MQNIPEEESGAIVDLSEIQRASLALVIARTVDDAMRQFLYGLDNEPDDLQISYANTPLIQEGMYHLGQEGSSFDEFSQFDGQGVPKRHP